MTGIYNVTKKDISETADSANILYNGREYYRKGRVSSLNLNNNLIKAKVAGRSLYDVEIDLTEDIDAECSCPYDGYGCKHIVAVLYKWLEQKHTLYH